MPTLRDALASTQARLELLLQASELLGRPLDYSATLANLASLLVPRVADGYVVDLVDERGDIKRIAAVDEDPSKATVVERLKHLGALNPKAPEGIQRILESGVARLNEHMTDEGLQAGARDAEHLAILRAIGPTSGIIVPLKPGGRALGLLWLYYSRSKRVYGPGDLALVEEIAARAALAIENAILWREATEAIRARDEFLAIASHELRTPLTALLLRVQGELRRLHKAPDYVPARAEVEVTLGAVNSQVARLARLVEDLLDVSRMTSGTMRLAREEVDLGRLTRESVAALEDDAQRKGCALRVDAPSGIIGAWDPIRIGQVVIALVSNAIKYGEGKPIAIEVTREGSTAQITVRDEGIGIDKAHVERIFDRFERKVSSRNYGGFGLGLWIARQIVEASGGAIVVESEPGQGATFRVTLPIEAPGTPTPSTVR